MYKKAYWRKGKSATAVRLRRPLAKKCKESQHYPIAYWRLHRVPKKTCDYIFYNNFNNKCPITIIFGMVSSKSMRHRKMVSFPTSPI